MKIAMFTNNYKPYVGGVPVSIEHLAAALRRIGHTVYIFAPSYENEEEEEFVIRYPSFPVKIAGAPVPNVLTSLFLKKVTELGIDIIHVHHPAIVGNVALAIRKKTGIPVVFTYHTRYEAYLHYIKPLEKVEEHTGVLEKYLNYFCNKCDLIVAPTPGIASYLQQTNLDTPVGVMPTGILEENFTPELSKAEEIRTQYAADADYLFCTVSRLAKEKNLDFLLDALVRLKELLDGQGKCYRHLIIGEGPEHKELAGRIRALGLEKNVVLLGNVPNPEIKNYQAASDLFFFTSKSETQGIVLLEAMAVGNPVIAVDASGVRDVVKNGVNGYLTKEDAGEFAAQAAAALSKEADYQKLCAGAAQTAEAYREGNVAKTAELYYVNVRARALQETRKTSFFHRYVVNS